MNRFMMAVPILLLVSIDVAVAQKQTEIYIPIGESPGLSGVYSDVGEIRAFDAATGALSLQVGGATRTVRVAPDTRIWLDRHEAGLRNVEGTRSDLVAGRRAEVKYEDPGKRQVAGWVKVAREN